MKQTQSKIDARLHFNSACTRKARGCPPLEEKTKTRAAPPTPAYIVIHITASGWRCWYVGKRRTTQREINQTWKESRRGAGLSHINSPAASVMKTHCGSAAGPLGPQHSSQTFTLLPPDSLRHKQTNKRKNKHTETRLQLHKWDHFRCVSADGVRLPAAIPGELTQEKCTRLVFIWPQGEIMRG